MSSSTFSRQRPLFSKHESFDFFNYWSTCCFWTVLIYGLLKSSQTLRLVPILKRPINRETFQSSIHSGNYTFSRCRKHHLAQEALIKKMLLHHRSLLITQKQTPSFRYASYTFVFFKRREFLGTSQRASPEIPA